MDVNKMADAVFESVRSYLDEAIKPLSKRVESVESGVSAIPNPPSAEDMRAELLPVIAEEIGKAHAESVEAGRRMVDEAISPLTEKIKYLEDALAAIPEPVALTAEDVKPEIMPGLLEEMQAAVSKAVAEIPVPKDGESCTVDDIFPVLMLEMSKWALDFERRAQDTFRKAIDSMPAPKDGKDGLDLDGFSAVQEKDGRVVMLSLTDGERTKHVHLHFPVVLDRGYWKEGVMAEKGDGYTHGGSYWIAQEDTDTKPEIDNPDWRLAVKRGRDAKPSARIGK